jgi:hypothetical protein
MHIPSSSMRSLPKFSPPKVARWQARLARAVLAHVAERHRRAIFRGRHLLLAATAAESAEQGSGFIGADAGGHTKTPAVLGYAKLYGESLLGLGPALIGAGRTRQSCGHQIEAASRWRRCGLERDRHHRLLSIVGAMTVDLALSKPRRRPCPKQCDALAFGIGKAELSKPSRKVLPRVIGDDEERRCAVFVFHRKSRRLVSRQKTIWRLVHLRPPSLSQGSLLTLPSLILAQENVSYA